MFIGTFTGHKNWVLSVMFSHDDKYVTSGLRDSEIRIWNVEQGGTMYNSCVLRGHDTEIDSVMFSSDNGHLILGLDNHKVIVWNVCSGMPIVGPFYCYSRYFYTILILIDSKYIIAGTGDDTVKVWDVELKKMVSEPFQGHKNLHLFTCSFSCNGTHTALCSGNKLV